MTEPLHSDERSLPFADWKRLAPQDAAREFRARALTRLSPAQQRAVFVEIPSEEKLTARFTAARASSSAGALSGVPFVLKDLFDVAGESMLAGSTFLPEVRPAPARDGAMVRALHEAGAVLGARTHLHEFAYGFTGENPHYGDCEHPRFPGRTTGGSSSGSAAAVAAGIVPLAIGTDTGGSVRVPAAYCGLFGFRMTPHHAWIADAFPLVPSFDTAGWFTANAADMRAAIAALIGLTPLSDASAPRGVYLDMPGLDEDVAMACREAASRFAPAADTATREQLHRAFASAPETYSVTVSREAWLVHESWATRFRDRYDPAVWERLDRVHTLTPKQIADAETGLASVRGAWAEFFRNFDFLVMPATPFAAPERPWSAPANRPRLLALTAPASIGGRPVLTVPVPLASGLSAGLQIVVNDARSPALAWATGLAM